MRCFGYLVLTLCAIVVASMVRVDAIEKTNFARTGNFYDEIDHHNQSGVADALSKSIAVTAPGVGNAKAMLANDSVTHRAREARDAK
jgi:uncharacterized protein YccT (UPF0319 family)